MKHTTQLIAVGAIAALALTACASTPGENETEETPQTSRVSLTYDGGILVLDGTTLEVEADIPLEGFNRLNPAGDGRHALVTTTAGFQVLDLGTWTDSEGSHVAAPKLTDLVFEAEAAGHVVRHDGKTILFADGTGDTTIFETAALLEGGLPETEVVVSEEAHHGVAIELADGTLLTTLGNSDTRTGVRALDASRSEVDRNEQCPSVHGEGAAANEVAVFGCSDGVLIYDSGEFVKVQSPDVYGRTGNQYVSETSTIAVGDYNSDPDSEGYLLTELVFIDTVAKTSSVVDLPEGVSYTWRGVGRGPSNEVLVLSSDGSLYQLDETTGDVTNSWAVIDPWESPVEWQDAHPALTINGSIAYVTEPATNEIHAIDLTTGDVTVSATLDAAPNEIAVVTG